MTSEANIRTLVGYDCVDGKRLGETSSERLTSRRPMHSLRFTAEASSDGVLERDFTLSEVTGVLWSPASGSEHAPLVLMGHGGGCTRRHRRSRPAHPTA